MLTAGSDGELTPAYLRLLETVENVSLRLVPNPKTTAMIATAMPAAIKPYSIAVAPCSLARKFQIKLRMQYFLSLQVAPCKSPRSDAHV